MAMEIATTATNLPNPVAAAAAQPITAAVRAPDDGQDVIACQFGSNTAPTVKIHVKVRLEDIPQPDTESNLAWQEEALEWARQELINCGIQPGEWWRQRELPLPLCFGTAATPAKRRIEILDCVTARDLIDYAAQNPLGWLIEDVLLKEGIHILHGHEESFKTMFALQLLEALVRGGEILLRQVKGGRCVGIAELEQKPKLFGGRLTHFFEGKPVPDIAVLPDPKRSKLLSLKNAKDRIDVLVEWTEMVELDFLVIDSSAKLLPPGTDPSRQDFMSEVFNQLQKLPTVLVIAHDRKPLIGTSTAGTGNSEIVGSGRFAQDPDIVHQMVRPDRRAPTVQFHWGKVREGVKPSPLDLFFDAVEFRLFSLHPFLHLVKSGPMLEQDIITEARRRYQWAERRARDHIASLHALTDKDRNPVIQTSMTNHKKKIALTGKPVPPDAADAATPAPQADSPAFSGLANSALTFGSIPPDGPHLQGAVEPQP